MKATEAKSITECMKILRKMKADISTLPRSLETVWKLIIWAIEDGKTECEIPYIPANVKVALDANNFVIKYSQVKGRTVYTVSWEPNSKTKNGTNKG